MWLALCNEADARGDGPTDWLSATRRFWLWMRNIKAYRELADDTQPGHGQP